MTVATVSSRPEGTSTTTRFSPSRRCDDPLVERPRDERDRPVAASGRVAGVVEEDDAEVGVGVVPGHDVTAVHVGVAPRLVDEQPADVVEPLERITSPLEDRRSAQRLDAAGDDPERLATGVVVDRPDRRSS